MWEISYRRRIMNKKCLHQDKYLIPRLCILANPAPNWQVARDRLLTSKLIKKLLRLKKKVGTVAPHPLFFRAHATYILQTPVLVQGILSESCTVSVSRSKCRSL